MSDLLEKGGSTQDSPPYSWEKEEAATQTSWHSSKDGVKGMEWEGIIREGIHLLRKQNLGRTWPWLWPEREAHPQQATLNVMSHEDQQL